jgi:redox-sensitive bicupin YhaK (pirin superfamily)
VIHQDVELLAALLGSGEKVTHVLPTARKAWLQVVRGRVRMNDHDLDTGDGAALEREPELTVTAKVDGTEILMFDLP